MKIKNMHDYTSELLIKPLSTNINENIKDIKCFISKFIFCGTIEKKIGYWYSVLQFVI